MSGLKCLSLWFDMVLLSALISCGMARGFVYSEIKNDGQFFLG